MGIKAFVVSRIAEMITGEQRLIKARCKAEAARKRAGQPHVISYFHQADDPYSHLAVQALAIVAERYEVTIEPYLVGPPADWATPERGYLQAYARLDAARLAQKSGLNFQSDADEPTAEGVVTAQRGLAQALGAGEFWTMAPKIGAELWRGVAGPAPTDLGTPYPIIAAGEAKRHELGHFMSAMIHYGGEWYWGLDRLHYLEARLADLGLRKPEAPAGPVWCPPISPLPDAKPTDGTAAPVLEFFLSFRSPYTYIATKRAKALADAYRAELSLKFVLPMVMRGLQVPPLKSRYFTLDTAREARRLNVPFGKICDPLGKPVERGYALVPWAMAQGRGYDFCLAFMEGVWSQGLDAGTDKGLETIVEKAGLDWRVARGLLGNEDWRAEAEANRLELVGLGHWGVPCFKLGETVVWGQDRLWVIEEALRTA